MQELGPGAFAAIAAALILAVAAIALAILLRRERSQHQVRAVEAERLRELAKARASRISTLSHEIRTPLALIKGAGELLADESPGPLTTAQARFVGTITSNCQQLVEMAESLLSQARLEANLFELRLEQVDLRSLVRVTVRELRRLHPGRLQLDDHGPALIAHADPRLLREVLWNLINNALRHAGADALVTVRVIEGEGEAIISVVDDGRGMDSAERTQLFEPLKVGGSERPGTGLGMSITEDIVDLHGGRILVDTAARRGTVIYVTLPLREESAA